MHSCPFFAELPRPLILEATPHPVNRLTVLLFLEVPRGLTLTTLLLGFRHEAFRWQRAPPLVCKRGPRRVPTAPTLDISPYQE